VVSSFNQNFLIAVGKAFGTYADWKYPMQMQEDIRMEDIIQMKDK
jgi:S-formylglutathione hydrolase FrmB